MARRTKVAAPPPTTATSPSICWLVDRLPAETRKQIFSYVLTLEWLIEFATIRPRPRPGPTKYVYKYHQRDPKRVDEVYDHSTRSWIRRPLIRTALLATCKQISTEAAEIFYGTNIFNPRTMSAAVGFLDSIDGPKYAIRNINVVDNLTTKAAKGFWASLVPLTNLRVLKLGHEALCPKSKESIPLKRLQCSIKPLLKVLRDSYRQQGITANPADVVHVVDYRCLGCICTCQPSMRCQGGCYHRHQEENEVRATAGHAALVKSVRSALVETLAVLDG